jgi:hypothetical protein
MGDQHHSIRRQFIDVELAGTEEDGFALQRRMSELWRERLVPALERAFDRLAVGDGHLYIRHLEVDAGTLMLGQVEEGLAESVARGLEIAIRQQLSGVGVLETGRNIRLMTDAQTLEVAFVHFLRTGRLPWSLRLPEGKSLEDVLLQSWLPYVTGAGTGNDGQSLASALGEPAARYRLANQFSPAFLQALVARLKGAPQGIDLESSRESGGEEGSAGGEEVARLLREPPSRGNHSKDPRSATESATGRGTDEDQTFAQEGEDGVSLKNAGLVLLHPFLVQCFESLGIARAPELVKPERALCMLHYLATGQRVAPEYELMLPKVLCGLPLEMPAASDVGLTGAELEEADALLGSVIRHWDALRSTSPDGLRGAFLLRPGILSLRDDGDWLLQVEPDASDILLNRLPWGCSMIQLPWMRRMLRVEWAAGM